MVCTQMLTACLLGRSCAHTQEPYTGQKRMLLWIKPLPAVVRNVSSGKSGSRHKNFLSNKFCGMKRHLESSFASEKLLLSFSALQQCMCFPVEYRSNVAQ